MRFIKETLILASPERVFSFHELPDAIERLFPPWEGSTIVQKADMRKIGSQTILETKILGFIPARFVAEHTIYDPPHVFEDVQISGPFKSWRHRHIVEPHEDGAVLRDEIEYEPPMWFLGRFAAPFAIEPRLQKLFEYRHNVTKKWCEGE